MLQFISWFRKYVCKTAYVISAALLLFMVCLAFVQMIGRYLVGANFLWADEVTVFCITYMIALSTPMLWLERDNINMDLFGEKLSPSLNFKSMVLVDIVSLFAAILLTYSGIQAALLHKGFVTSFLGYDESVRYYFVIVFGVLLCITITLELIERVLLYRSGKGVQK